MTDEGKAAAAERLNQLRARGTLITVTRDEILKLLQAAQDRIKLILAGQPTETQKWQLTQLQNEIALQLQIFSDDAGARLSAAAGRAWTAGQALIDAPLEAAAAVSGVRASAFAPVLDTRQLLAMRAFMVDRIKDVGVEAAGKIKTELGLVTMGAKPQSEAVTAITKILGEKSRGRAITITRSNILGVYDVAAFERLQQSAESDPTLKKQWRRSGKIHSRISHDLADGQIREVNQPFTIWSKNGPVEMMHPHDPTAPISETINCGCTALPWKEAWGMATPGRRRYTEAEMKANPMKRDIQEALDDGKTIEQAMKEYDAA